MLQYAHNLGPIFGSIFLRPAQEAYYMENDAQAINEVSKLLIEEMPTLFDVQYSSLLNAHTAYFGARIFWPWTSFSLGLFDYDSQEYATENNIYRTNISALASKLSFWLFIICGVLSCADHPLYATSLLRRQS